MQKIAFKSAFGMSDVMLNTGYVVFLSCIFFNNAVLINCEYFQLFILYSIQLVKTLKRLSILTVYAESSVLIKEL